jgi:hypothetical protein
VGRAVGEVQAVGLVYWERKAATEALEAGMARAAATEGEAAMAEEVEATAEEQVKAAAAEGAAAVAMERAAAAGLTG